MAFISPCGADVVLANKARRIAVLSRVLKTTAYVAHAVRLAIMGYHFEKVTQQQVAIDDFKQYLVAELDTFRETVGRFAQAPNHRIGDIGAQVQALFAHARKQYNGIHSDFRHSVQDALQGFQQSVFHQYLEAELHVLKSGGALCQNPE